jgi:ribosome-associated heat shock protein Hsp15
VTARDDRCRADVWLWRARFFKSRSLAAAALNAGAVRLARAGHMRRAEAATALKPGDELVFAALNSQVRAVRVAALGDRRGPATEALALYEEIPSPLDDDSDAVS